MAKKPEAPRGATPKAEPKERRNWKLNLSFGDFPWRYVSWVASGILVLVIGLYAGKVAYKNWPIQDIQVGGALSAWSLEGIAKELSWVRGESFLSLDVDKVRTTLEALPLVAQVSVSKRWPGVVVIHMVEDVPIALWNQQYLLSANGKLSAVPENLDISQLTAMQGPDNQTQVAVQYFRRVQQLLNTQTVKVQNLTISSVGSVEVLLSNGWQVEFGRQYIEDRIIRLEQLLRYLPFERVSKVDLRYGKGAAISWRTQEMG